MFHRGCVLLTSFTDARPVWRSKHLSNTCVSQVEFLLYVNFRKRVIMGIVGLGRGKIGRVGLGLK